MTPEYIEELADMVDPDKLWKRGAFERLDMPEDQRRQLDAGIALRRHAGHIRRLRELMNEGRSLLLTPLAEHSTAVKAVDTPADHAGLRTRRDAHVDGVTTGSSLQQRMADALAKLICEPGKPEYRDQARAALAEHLQHTHGVQACRARKVGHDHWVCDCGGPPCSHGVMAAPKHDKGEAFREFTRTTIYAGLKVSHADALPCFDAGWMAAKAAYGVREVPRG